MKQDNMVFSADERFMNEALKEADKALSKKEVPIGAIVVHKGRIIARAFNLTDTLNDPTAHAEMQAITMATDFLGGKYLKECSLYVTIEPCPMCAAALNWAQLGKLIYGADDPKRGYSMFAPSLLHPKTDVLNGILTEECSAKVSNFFKQKR